MNTESERPASGAPLPSGYLLLVEDEPAIQEKNKKILERRGYALRQAFSLAQARAIVAEQPPRAVILDIVLPDGHGLDFLKELRQTSNVPVLMLTAMGTSQDVIRGLAAGGDDYLTKPYELPVFLVRVEALLRRASIVPDMLEAGPLRIEPASNRAYLNGEDIGLNQKEMILLQQFVQQPEKVLSAEYLYEKGWGQKPAGDDHALKTTVSRLRAKLAGSGYTIAASRGEGYCLERE